jgi:hypothetical protein
MEKQRRIGAKPRTPPKTETRPRVEHALGDGARFGWSFVETDGRTARDQMCVGTRFVQKAGQIDRQHGIESSRRQVSKNDIRLP